MNEIAAPRRPRVLMLAVQFYPCQVTGAHRPAKFCKYLPQFGYDATVITVDAARAGWPTDPRLAAQLPPDTRVVRAFYPFSAALKQRAGAWVRGWRRNRPADAGPNGPQTQSAVGAAPDAGARVEDILNRWLSVPDKDIYWLPWALAAGIRAARECDLIYATAPSFSATMIGAALKQLTGRPLVVDFRDPWTLAETHRPVTPLHARLDRACEEYVFRRADAIVCNTQPVCEGYRRRYPLVRPDQVHVLTNGYDDEDFRDLPDAGRCDGRVRIGHFGTIYVGRDPGPLFRAARDAVSRGLIPSDAVEFVFYGPSGAIVRQIAEREHVLECVQNFGTVPYAEALRQMAACDVLLILSSPSTDALHIPAKTFEYLPLRKAVLALAGPGALGDLMQQYRFGLRVGPDDHERLVAALTTLVSDIRAGRVERYLVDDPARLSRREITRGLARIFDQVRREHARRAPLAM